MIVQRLSFIFWQSRLRDFDISFHTETRFGETYIQFTDPDALLLELVERKEGHFYLKMVSFYAFKLATSLGNRIDIKLSPMMGQFIILHGGQAAMKN